MKNLSYVIGFFLILVALASCGARDSEDASSEVIPSPEVSSFVDEHGEEIVEVEAEDVADANEDKSSLTSQLEGNQPSSAGQQSEPTQQSSNAGSSTSTEAASQSSSEFPLGSVGNEYAVEPQNNEALPPLGSAENPYAVEPQGKATMQEDEDYKWEYKGEKLPDSPPKEPQDNEALPPLGSAENPYAVEPIAESSPSDDVAEGLIKE